MANTWINKIKLWYLKPLFGLWIYITILLPIYHNLLITFNLQVWFHVIYPHKILINGS